VSPEPLLSILTPAVPRRIHTLASLSSELETQIGDLPVEHLILVDNKRRTVGEKRDALLRAARGRYVAFVDDDDWINPGYINHILAAIKHEPDVITFLQRAYVDDAESTVEFRLGNPNNPFNRGGVTLRNAWHVCAWRRSIAICSKFPATNYGEDWSFAAPLCAIPNLQAIHIPYALHEYHHNSKTTEAPPPAG